MREEYKVELHRKYSYKIDKSKYDSMKVFHDGNVTVF